MRRTSAAGRGRSRAALALAITWACGTNYAQTAAPPAPDSGGSSGAGATSDAGSGATSGSDLGGAAANGADAGAGGATLPHCGTTLRERLSVSSFSTDVDVRYKKQGYDLFPLDERIALAVDTAGSAAVAWLDNTAQSVHVTAITASGTRAAADVVVPGVDIGGLVLQRDGFALLTRRDDPGEPLEDPAANGAIATAALLVRVRDGTESFAAPLTGTASVVEGVPANHRRDCAPVSLNGRLAFNGQKYGAYFQVHGCAGNWSAPYYGDKLVYVDDRGEFVPGGWDWKCSINQGLRLLPEAGMFTSVCLSDGAPAPGLNLVFEQESIQLAAEATNIGYCAGQFGSLVKLDDGSYLVGWLSRGVRASNPREAEKPATDIAILRLGPDRRPSGPLTWVVVTPDQAETNLHLAPYGPDRVLMIWDSLSDLVCSPETCFGSYTGTHARLIDLVGNFQSPDELIPAPPSSGDDLVVYPNGDLGWAFVPDDARDYSRPLRLDGSGIPDAPRRREIAVARLRYCR